MIELLFSASIVGIAAAGISGLVLLNSISSQTVFNKVDGLNAVKTVVDRIGQNIRQAQNICDQFDNADKFPSMGKNPLYGSGQAPLGGWPISPWPPRPYQLSNTCLILQLPVFFVNSTNSLDPNNGYPTRLDPADPSFNPSISVPYPNVDTYVYQVLPDQQHPGQYILQVAMFPGVAPPAPAPQRPIINPPQTVLKGIVGPLNQTTGQPEVFHYLDKTVKEGTAFNSIHSSSTNVTGVIMNLEVRRTNAGQMVPSNVIIKSEFYLRNNAVATP